MAQCTIKRCRSDKPGLWEPIVLLWPAKPTVIPAQPANIHAIGHRICDECVKKVTPLDFIPTLDDWTRIKSHFKEHGKAIPTLKTAKLSFMMPETTGLIRGNLA